MVECKLVSFAALTALWSHVTLLIKLIRILLKWKYIKDKNNAILAAMLRKRRYFVQKSLVPVTRAGVFIWENFHPGYRDLGRKYRDLRNRVSPASLMNTFYEVFLRNFTKERVARRDLGNRVSPVERAQMKRP